MMYSSHFSRAFTKYRRNTIKLPLKPSANICDASITAKVDTMIFHFVKPWYLVTFQHHPATRIQTLKRHKLTMG